MIPRLLVAATAASLAGAPVDAQIFRAAPPSPAPTTAWSFDFGPQFARPVGEFRTQVDDAWGGGATVRYRLPSLAALGVRGDVAYLNYGHERQSFPLSSRLNRVNVDMTTANNIFVVTGGPEVALPRGPVQPYAYVVAGYSYFFTESSVGDDGDGGSFASTTNYDDGGLATGAGGGIRIPFRIRSLVAAIDAGARLTRNGTRTYLTPGDIIDLPDGSLQFTPRTTETDLWQYHVAFSVSPRRKR